MGEQRQLKRTKINAVWAEIESLDGGKGRKGKLKKPSDGGIVFEGALIMPSLLGSRKGKK